MLYVKDLKFFYFGDIPTLWFRRFSVLHFGESNVNHQNEVIFPLYFPASVGEPCMPFEPKRWLIFKRFDTSCSFLCWLKGLICDDKHEQHLQVPNKRTLLQFAATSILEHSNFCLTPRLWRELGRNRKRLALSKQLLAVVF